MNTRPRTRWTRTLAFLAITWAVALAVLLAGTEIVLRATDDGWGRTMRLNLIRDRTIEYNVADLYPGSNSTVRYQRNVYGLRDDCASPGDIDILTVGGSTTDQRYLALEETFQSVMQDELSETVGTAVCVSNAGVDGHSTYGHLSAFRDWFPLIPDLKPKLFVFSIGINDANFTREGPSSRDSQPGGGVKGAIKRTEVGQLGLWLADVIRTRSHPNPAYAAHVPVAIRSADYPVAELAADTSERAARNAEAFRLRLRRLLRDAHEYGAETVCVAQPHRFVRTRAGTRWGTRPWFGWDGTAFRYGGLDFDYSLRMLDAVMREECGVGRVVDLYNAPFADGDFYDYVHTTPSGSRKEGHLLAQFIARSGLADRLRAGPPATPPTLPRL